MYIELNATDPPAPAGAQNVHFRADATHLGTSGDPQPVSAYVSPFTGDSGSGGASGLVPAPAAGDAAAGKVLKADGTWYELPVVVFPTAVNFCVVDGSAGTSIGPLLLASHAGFLSMCRLSVTSADSSVGLRFRIKQNGIDVFTTDPTVAQSAAMPFVSTFPLSSTSLAVAAGDQFTIDIISGSSGWKFTAQLS